jgi:ATP-binding cassette subfamily B protein
VHLIPRFYDATGGAVLVDGTDVRDYDIDTLRSRIGMVLQSNILFSGTIREKPSVGKAGGDGGRAHSRGEGRRGL